MKNSFFLVEYTTNRKKIEEVQKINKNLKFISLDIMGHKILEEMKIKHKLIEDYLKKSDVETIDKKTTEICFEWYSKNFSRDYLLYDGINLGWILELELFSYIIQILKKFVGIKNFVNSESIDEIYTSNQISLMINQISNNFLNNIFIIEKKSSQLYFDEIEIPITVRKKIYYIRLSRKNFLKIKNLFEIITYNLFNLKIKKTKIKMNKNILFLNFDPLQYEEMFTRLKDLDSNIILLNERKPPALKFSSLKKLKNMNCKILKLENFIDLETKNYIKNQQIIFSNNFNKLLSDDENLSKYFSIMDISYWNCIKNDFKIMCSARFNEAIKRSILSKKFFSLNAIKKIIVLFSTAPEEKIILSQSHKKNIPGIVLQHGYWPHGEYVKKYLPTSPVIPQLGLINGVWGNFSSQLLLNLNIDKNNFKIIGSPKHEIFFSNNDSKNKKDLILFIESYSNEVDCESIDSYKIIQNENILKKIISYTNDIKKFKLVTKLHPGKHIMNYTLQTIIKSVDPSIPIFQSGNIFDLLKNCKILIASELSTAVIEAMILKIPTIVFLSHSQWNVDEKIFQINASIKVTDFEEFKNAIDQLINDSNYRNLIIDNATKFIDEQFSNKFNSIESFKEFLK